MEARGADAFQAGVGEWLALARTGSVDSLGRALEACRGYLLLIAQQEMEPELQAKGGASDLVQETFLKAHRHFGRFHGDTEGELLAWLRRLLLNNLIDFRRLYLQTHKRQARKEISLQSGPSRPDGSSIQGVERLASDESTPSGIAMEDEQAQALRQAMDRLPEEYRQVLLWRQQDELTFEEIGRRMDRSADAARKLWARAAARLQKEWDASP